MSGCEQDRPSCARPTTSFPTIGALDGAGDALGLEAAGADLRGLDGAALADADGLKIGQPATARLAHRVTDVIACDRTFSAHVASFCHEVIPLRQQVATRQPPYDTTS